MAMSCSFSVSFHGLLTKLGHIPMSKEEELYQISDDPECLSNLADDPQFETTLSDVCW